MFSGLHRVGLGLTAMFPGLQWNSRSLLAHR